VGYFANGEEGMMYEERYCLRCVHGDAPEGCAVWNAHFLRNHDECNNPDSILHMLIPRDGVHNQ
jgi:hypothetical protein